MTALYHNPGLINQVQSASYFWNGKINTPLGELFLIDKAMESISNSIQIDSLVNELSNINTIEIYETNFKIVLEFRLNAFKNGSNWTNEEISILESIASQCPYTGGKGVGIARSLLDKDFRDYDDEELCDKIKIRNTSIEQSDEALLYPNPTINHFDICLNQEFENGKVEVYNIMGQLVHDDKLEKNEIQKRIELNLNKKNPHISARV